MIKKELIFYLPTAYPYNVWASLDSEVAEIFRGHGVKSRTEKNKKLRRQTLTLHCPNEVAFINSIVKVAGLMYENSLEDTLISHRNFNVCEMIDMIETA